MMYISLHASGKNKQNVYVRVMESTRDANGKVQKRVIENLGRLSELIKKDPQALEKLKAKYQNDRQSKKEAVIQQRLRSVHEMLSLQPNGDLAEWGLPALKYGHYPLKKLWDQFLHLNRKINYLRKTEKVSFDVNSALLYLVSHKIMNLGSVQRTFSDKDNFLGDPARALSLDHFYAAYDFIHDHHDEIFSWINKKLDGHYGEQRATLVFYDVTNVYFEAQMTDSEREEIRGDFPELVQERADQWRAENRLTEDCFDEDGYVIANQLPQEFWDSLDEDKLKFLRMRGPSKEHRFDLPLVSIALVIDRNGMPMDVAVYSGNSSEFKTMSKSIDALKKKYHIQDAIVVADRGLNSLGNLNMLQDSGMGFLMAQKISQFSESLTKKMLNRSAYTPFNKNNPEAGGYRVIDDWEKSGIGGKIKCKLVLTFDERRKRRDEAILDMLVEIVKAKQAAGVKVSPKKTGWAALAKIDGEIEKEIQGIDEEVLAKKKALCGFAALVYKAAPVKESKTTDKDSIKIPDLDGDQIVSTYRVLNQIETCFRIMKSNLGLRPMFVRTAAHIMGHVDICVLALLMVRIIQWRLQESGGSLSAQRIAAALNGMQVVPIPAGQDALNFASLCLDRNFRRGLEKTATEQIKELLEQNGLGKSEKAQVLQACDMKSIPLICSRTELASALGVRFPTNSAALPELVETVLNSHFSSTSS